MFDQRAGDAGLAAVRCPDGQLGSIISRARPRQTAGFAGLSVEVSWDGSGAELARILQPALIGLPFRLVLVQDATGPAWSCIEIDPALHSVAKPGDAGHFAALFQTIDRGRARPEAHVPRLIEAISARATWVSLIKLNRAQMTRSPYRTDKTSLATLNTKERISE